MWPVCYYMCCTPKLQIFNCIYFRLTCQTIYFRWPLLQFLNIFFFFVNTKLFKVWEFIKAIAASLFEGLKYHIKINHLSK